MIFHHTGSKDTYITNKIVNGVVRAEGANVGYASTVDLFKLYGETTLANVSGICTIDDVDYTDKTEQECSSAGGVWNPNLTELSRALIYFDLEQLKEEIESMVAIDGSLKIKLQYSDVQGTQVAPQAYSLELCPLNVEFEEGIGDNIVTFADSYAASWLQNTSLTNWSTSGGGDDIGASIASQYFESGYESLDMDITAWVQSHWADSVAVPNYGWMLKFIEAEETDNKSYFVKRFASRHTRNPMLRPKLVVQWDSYHIDDRLDFTSNSSNVLSIKNFSKGELVNVTNEPTITLTRGAWSKEASSSVVTASGLPKNGFYEATIPALDLQGTDNALLTDLENSGSILLQERWSYEDNEDPANSVLLYSGSLSLKWSNASSSSMPKEYRFTIINANSTYTHGEIPTIRLFVREKNLANEPVRIPIQLKSQIIQKAYFQIKDTNKLNVLVPFSDALDIPDESTRISSDGDGMYFNFPVSVLPRGRTYTIDIAYYDRGIRRVWESNLAFKVK